MTGPQCAGTPGSGPAGGTHGLTGSGNSDRIPEELHVLDESLSQSLIYMIFFFESCRNDKYYTVELHKEGWKVMAIFLLSLILQY